MTTGPLTPLASIRIVGYTRVSIDDQVVRGSSLKDQPAKIREFATRSGLDLVELIEDAGECSKTLDRPGLQKILAMLSAKEIDGLAIAYLDRLTRHVGDMCHLVETYFTEAGGPNLYSASEHVETRTASGRMQLYIQIVVSQYQRESIVERTAGAMKGKRSRSERSGNIPFGWMLDPADTRRSKAGHALALVPCPEDLANEQVILGLRAGGMKLREIAAAMNARGIPSKRGVTKKSTGLWSKSTIGEILMRSRKIGVATCD